MMAAAAARTLPGLLCRRAAQEAAAPAFRQKRRGVWRSRDWAAVLGDVRALAADLAAHGFAAGDRLLLVGEASVEWLIAELAAQWLGGASVTPYPDAPAAELAEAIAQAPARFVAVDDAALAQAVGAVGGADPVWRVLLRPAGGDGSLPAALARGAAGSGVAAPACHSATIATIAFTPGAGGCSRAVPLSHGELIDKAAVLADALGIGEAGLHSFCQVPPAHIAARVLGPGIHLLHGGVLFFAERIDTVGVDLAEAQPRMVAALPWQWHSLHRGIAERLAAGSALAGRLFARRLAGRRDAASELLVARPLRRHLGLSRTRLAVVHGGDLAPATERFLAALRLGPVVGYGLTQTAGWSLLRRGGGWAALPGTTAHVSPQGELLLDTDGRRLATGDAATPGAAPPGPAGPQPAADDDPAAVALARRLTDSPFIGRAVVTRRGVAVIEVDAGAVGAWARRHGHAYTTYHSLVTLAAVEALIGAEVARIAAAPAGVAVSRCRILPAPLTRAGWMLTATGSLRRPALERLIADLPQREPESDHALSG